MFGGPRPKQINNLIRKQMKLKNASRVKSTRTNGFADGKAKNLGKFADFLDETDMPFLSNANLERDGSDGQKAKLVGVFINTADQKEDELPFAFYCSKRLSVTVRKAVAKGKSHEAILAGLLCLDLVENEIGQYIAPKGDLKAKMTVKQLLEANKVTYLDLVAYGRD